MIYKLLGQSHLKIRLSQCHSGSLSVQRKAHAGIDVDPFIEKFFLVKTMAARI